MGFASALFGKNNSSFNAQAAPIMNLTNGNQIADAASGSLLDLRQQQALVNQLQAQNGIQNQSDVYNQLQQVASGQGPNPAQALLNNATGQNVAQQAALMASQRGVGANPALIARQAAQQGAQIQQNAIGQNAALQAQQSLGAIGQAGQLAGQQVGQQQQAIGQLNQLQQNEQQNLLNAGANTNSANVQNAAQQNNANAEIAKENAKSGQGLLGSLSGAVGTGLKLAGSALFPPAAAASAIGLGSNAVSGQGMFAEGGQVSPVMAHLTGSNVGTRLQSGGKVPGKAVVGGAKNSYANDKVKALLSPGEIVIPRSVTQSKDPVRGAAEFVAATMAKSGKSLPPKKK